MKKKFLALLIAVLSAITCTLCFTACNIADPGEKPNEDPGENHEEPNPPAEEKTGVAGTYKFYKTVMQNRDGETVEYKVGEEYKDEYQSFTISEDLCTLTINTDFTFKLVTENPEPDGEDYVTTGEWFYWDGVPYVIWNDFVKMEIDGDFLSIDWGERMGNSTYKCVYRNPEQPAFEREKPLIAESQNMTQLATEQIASTYDNTMNDIFNSDNLVYKSYYRESIKLCNSYSLENTEYDGCGISENKNAGGYTEGKRRNWYDTENAYLKSSAIDNGYIYAMNSENNNLGYALSESNNIKNSSDALSDMRNFMGWTFGSGFLYTLNLLKVNDFEDIINGTNEVNRDRLEQFLYKHLSGEQAGFHENDLKIIIDAISAGKYFRNMSIEAKTDENKFYLYFSYSLIVSVDFKLEYDYIVYADTNAQLTEDEIDQKINFESKTDFSLSGLTNTVNQNTELFKGDNVEIFERYNATVYTVLADIGDNKNVALYYYVFKED